MVGPGAHSAKHSPSLPILIIDYRDETPDHGEALVACAGHRAPHEVTDAR